MSIEQLLADLVGMRTIDGEVAANDAALDYIERFLAERGMHCTRHRFNGNGALIASSLPHNAKTPTVLLAGHVDVVHGSDALFSLRQEGDKLKGRGVYDMKFAIAGYLKLIDNLRGHTADYDFAIMITTDEERGGRDGVNGTRSFVEEGYAPKICILPDSAAPDWGIEILSKGHWRFELIARGKTAHSSRPWEGESASSKLLKGLYQLDKHFEHHGPLTDTLNIGVLKGGERYNQIPSLVTAAIEIRLHAETSYETNKAYIDNLCTQYDLSYATKNIVPPIAVDLKNPFVQAYVESVQKVTGRQPKAQKSFAGTDAVYFARVGVVCIVSSVNGGGHHSEDEWISKSSLQYFVPIIQEYLDCVAKTASTPVDKTVVVA